jgi:hypothetical protein
MLESKAQQARQVHKECRASKASKAAQGLQVSVLQGQLGRKEKQALLVHRVLLVHKAIRVVLRVRQEPLELVLLVQQD